MVLFAMGHWSLICLGSFCLTHSTCIESVDVCSKGKFIDVVHVPGVGCIVVHTNVHILMATITISMGFDLVTMLLTAYKLQSYRNYHRNGIATVLLRDGLVYFICAYGILLRSRQTSYLLISASSFLANLVATVFLAINLSPIMGVIFNMPANITCVVCQ